MCLLAFALSLAAFAAAFAWAAAGPLCPRAPWPEFFGLCGHRRCRFWARVLRWGRRLPR